MKYSHVKINFGHQLYRMQGIGGLPFENQKNMLIKY